MTRIVTFSFHSLFSELADLDQISRTRQKKLCAGINEYSQMFVCRTKKQMMHEDVFNAVYLQCGREIRDWVIVCGGSRLLCRESPSSGAGGRGVTLIGHQYTQSRGALSACWPNKCFPPNIGGDWERKKYYTIFRGQEGGGWLRTRGKKSILKTLFHGNCKISCQKKTLQSSNCCPGSKIPFSKNNKKESNQFCCG